MDWRFLLLNTFNFPIRSTFDKAKWTWVRHALQVPALSQLMSSVPKRLKPQVVLVDGSRGCKSLKMLKEETMQSMHLQIF